MEISAITTKDIPRCAETFIATYNQMPWNYSWKHEDAIKYLNEYTEAPRFTGFMVLDEGSVAGALFGHPRTWWTNNQFMIDELFIAPGMQGKGYGKLLLRHLEEHVRMNKIETITLMTNKFMPALDFYNKHDFNKVDQYIFMFKQL